MVHAIWSINDTYHAILGVKAILWHYDFFSLDDRMPFCNHTGAGIFLTLFFYCRLFSVFSPYYLQNLVNKHTCTEQSNPDHTLPWAICGYDTEHWTSLVLRIHLNVLVSWTNCNCQLPYLQIWSLNLIYWLKIAVSHVFKDALAYKVNAELNSSEEVQNWCKLWRKFTILLVWAIIGCFVANKHVSGI